MAIPNDVLALIGNTPMVEVRSFDTGPCRLFLKLECQNPGGSIKDRVALAMIEAAERDGLVARRGTIVEATAGNTGIGLALVAGRKGYRLTLVIPDKMSREKVFNLRAMGAEVVMTRSDVGKGHPEYYQDMAERIARECGGFYVNQFGNPANPLAHERGTAPEIWEQMDHDVDAVVAGVGSGGTLAGLSRFFERVSPATGMVLADPAGSVLAEFVADGRITRPAGSWLVEGIGEDFVPEIADLSRVRQAITVTDAEAFECGRALLRGEGILAGSSTGVLLAAALRWCRAQTEPKRCVTLVPDSGNKYLSKMFNDFWMIDQGFVRREAHGDLTDLISRRHVEHATVCVAPDDAAHVAYARMKMYDVSQIPVCDGERIVGIVDESDLLLAVFGHEDRFRRPVREVMTTRLETLHPTAPVSALLPIFDRGLVAIVQDGERFLGLITRIDLLNHLRRRMG
ncbi:MAG: cystathionine beta-synthase [Deltaproteobacteria bacterium]|nr:cystathionine beta-synthase [Deltaproteobacteria bacterium]